MLFAALLFLCSTGIVYISKIDPISISHKVCLGLFILVAIINLIWFSFLIYSGLVKANDAFSLARRVDYLIPLYDLKKEQERSMGELSVISKIRSKSWKLELNLLIRGRNGVDSPIKPSQLFQFLW